MQGSSPRPCGDGQRDAGMTDRRACPWQGVWGRASGLSSLHRSCQESLGHKSPDLTQASVQEGDETQLDSASYSSLAQKRGLGRDKTSLVSLHASWVTPIDTRASCSRVGAVMSRWDGEPGPDGTGVRVEVLGCPRGEVGTQLCFRHLPSLSPSNLWPHHTVTPFPPERM